MISCTAEPTDDLAITLLRTQAMVTDALLGETIPIRLFLGGFDLTPTFREVNKKYSTRYYLSLVLIDEGKCSTVSCSLNVLSLFLLHLEAQNVGFCHLPMGPAS